jgi:triacylglycerol lipase
MTTYNRLIDPSQKTKDAVFVRDIGKTGAYYRCGELHILAFRGTATKTDALMDLNFSQVAYSGKYKDNTRQPLVHSGFHSYWQSHRKDIQEIIGKLPQKSEVIFTGHSMGAAVASIGLLDAIYTNPHLTFRGYIIGSPQIGDDAFYAAIQESGIVFFSVENSRDVVTQLPPPVAPTWSTSYIYDHASMHNIISLNFETGSLMGNHHLDSYAIAIDNNPCPTNWKWIRS